MMIRQYRLILSIAVAAMVMIALLGMSPTVVWSQPQGHQLAIEHLRLDIEQVVRERLEQLQIDPHDIEIRILSPTEPISVPAGVKTTRLVMRDSRAPVGRVGFELVMLSNGKRVKRQTIVADVDVFREVLVAAHRLRRHQVIAQGDVMLSPVKMSHRAGEYLVDPQRVIGQRLMQAIQAGVPVVARFLDEPPLIQKKQRVTIVAEHGSIRILATGVATEDGYRGEIIKVVNIDSNRQLLAQVTGVSTVKIDF